MKQALADPAIRAEAAEVIRRQIERITLTPNDEAGSKCSRTVVRVGCCSFCEVDERTRERPGRGEPGRDFSFARGTRSYRLRSRYLMRLPESGPAHHYSKGISVVRDVDGTIDVGDLIIDHPGLQPVSVGVNMGWHYTADEKGTWTRVLHDDDCSCPNAWRHEHHLSALTIIEH